MLVFSNNIIKEVKYLKCDFKRSSILFSIEKTTAELFNYYRPYSLVKQPTNNKKKSLAPYRLKKIKIPNINKFSNKPGAKEDFEVWKSNIWNKVLLNGGLV